MTKISLPVLSLEELLYKGTGRERRGWAFKALVIFINRWLNALSLQVRFDV